MCISLTSHVFVHKESNNKLQNEITKNTAETYVSRPSLSDTQPLGSGIKPNPVSLSDNKITGTYFHVCIFWVVALYKVQNVS